MYRRQNLPHFKNHTNNRLESFFGKLKDSIDGSMGMSSCVKALLACDRRKENEYKCRLSRIGRFVSFNYAEENASTNMLAHSKNLKITLLQECFKILTSLECVETPDTTR